MAGLVFYLENANKNTANSKLKKLQNILKIPNLKYSEQFLTGDTFLAYSCVPDFIKDQKLLSINNCIIALDGDFYNENELMLYLKHQNLTKLEIIYYLYKKEGNNFADLINGEFNIIIYDSIINEVVATNDRFARKAFFYKKLKNGIIFSSEKKGILSISDGKNSLDKIGIFQIISMGHNFDRRTFITNINKLKPADVLFLKNNGLNTGSYFTWKFNTDLKSVDRNELIQQMHDKLIKSLEIRLKSKKRILLWLSGGIDSRSIALSINKDKRRDINVESYGEDYSGELGIVHKLSKILGYNLTTRSVKMDYTKIGKIGNWKTEFALVPFEHPHVSFHNEIKSSSDYIIGGLPGFDVLNGGTISLGKIYGSLYKDSVFKWFLRYSRSQYDELEQFFNKESLSTFYPELVKSFEISFNKIDIPNKLDKWDIFTIYERQPNFGNISDMYETDLFETLHPFCDTDLVKTFLQVPLKLRIFQQLSKDMLYKYYPEVREIPFDGRGKLSKNNSLLDTFWNEILNRYYYKKISYSIWNIKKSFQNDITKIETDLKRIFDYPELSSLLNLDFIKATLSSKSVLYEYYDLAEKLISILYAYETFIYPQELSIPQEVIEYYN